MIPPKGDDAMRSSTLHLTLAGAALMLAPAVADAQQTSTGTAPGRTVGSVISSHQIDRYEAIRQLRTTLAQDPNSLADWIILGELAQEVSGEVPADQAGPYYAIARDAYANALQIAPDDANLQAAYQFARDQEADAQRFNQGRAGLASSYIEARRRELTREGRTPAPSLRVYSMPATMPEVPERTAAQAATDAGVVPSQTAAANAMGSPYYGPTYRPYADGDRPYTYQDYSQSYFPPTTNPNGQNVAPMTLRDYVQGLPNVLQNEASRALQDAAGTGVGTAAPAGAPAGAPGSIPPR